MTMVHAAVWAVVVVPAVLACVRKWRERGWGWCRCSDEACLQERVFVVTGASSGIGLETARALAKRRARVVLACRDLQRARAAVEDIRRRDPDATARAHLIPMQLDLASLKSIREFSEAVLKDFPQIHVLINNAGVYFPLSAEQKTSDGFEVHLGVNHLGHFLLTNLLLPRLKSSAPSRVVIVASSLFENSVKTFSPSAVPPGYSSSKLANVLFCKELAKRTHDTGVSVYAVCPGFTYTRLFRSRTLKWYHYLFMAPIAFFFMRTATQGAQTVLHCATSKEVAGETGLIYRDCKLYKPKNTLKPEIAEELWHVSEKMVKLSPSEVAC